MTMNVVARTLEQLRLGAAQSVGNLAVFPLLAEQEVEPGYLTLAQALAAEQVRIREVSEGGSVPELLLENRGKRAVLLLDGDELVGARQNRVLNVTVLVGPERSLLLPVSCVERGRWGYRGSRDFSSEDRMMFARARAEKMAQVTHSLRTSGTRHSDQGAVWAAMSRKAAALATASPTEAMRDVYRHAAGEVSRYRASVRALPRQVGAVFALAGRPAGLELFDASRTLHGSLGRLVESYAMDALEEADALFASPGPGEAARFLAQALAARAHVAKSVGEGEDVRLEGAGLVGQALVAEGRLVHLSVLRAAGDTGGAGPSGRGTSRRRRSVA